MTERQLRFGVIALFGIVSIIACLGGRPGRIGPRDLDWLVEAGACAYVDPVSVHIAFDTMLAGTPHEGRYQVNGRYDSSLLNVYIVHSDGSSHALPRSPKFDRLKMNAVAMPQIDAIVIDAALLYELARLQGVGRDDWGVVGHLLAWIIGHEYGHIELGHGVSHWTFDTAMTARHSACDAIDRRELDADRVFVRRMMATGSGTADSVVRVLMELVVAVAGSDSSSGDRPLYFCRAVSALREARVATTDPVLAASINAFLRAFALEGDPPA